jgi:hypothetical protein
MYIAEQKSSGSDTGPMFPVDELNLNFSAEYCLDKASEALPVLKSAIEEHGDDTLSEYLNHLMPSAGSSYQSMTDLLEVVNNYTKPLLGESIAKQVANDIEACPFVLTANHHGVAYFAQDLQGSIIFSLNKITGENSGTTVPVFSCGTVPLDNLTYPLGMLFYRVGNGELDAVPRRLPVFSNKNRRRLVSVVDPVDEDMIKRAQKRVDKLVRDQIICASLAEPAHKILQKEYCASSVMNMSTYSRQAVVLNNSIWNRLFKGLSPFPEIVEKDLTNSESLVSCIMFDAKLRENVFEELDGSKACWQTKKLLMRLHADPFDKTEQRTSNGCGTMLFWGLDDWGRRVPLYLEATSRNCERLHGVDDRGKTLEWPYSPESVKEGINQGKLLPSIFTSYLVVSLARGVVCAGGYFQCEYLPAMQQGIVNALKKTGGYDIVAKLVSNVPTNTYLSGMIAVMTRISGGYLIPAGPVEILAGGGFKKDDIEQLLSLTVRDAHIGGLSDTLPDLPAWVAPSPEWKTKLAADIAQLLENKVVIK